jgi:AraC-like DNA-binding protein
VHTNDGLAGQCVLLEPPVRHEFVTRDASEAITYFQDAYHTSMKFSGVRDGRTYRHTRLESGGVAVDEVHLPLQTGVKLEPFGALVVVNLHDGLFERDCAGVSERFAPGDVFIDADPALPARLRMLDNHIHTIMIELSMLAQVADVTDRAPAPLRFSSFQPISRAAGAQWKRAVAFFSDTLAQREAAAHPLVRGAAARLVAASALATFPNTALQPAAGRDERDATSATVRRAVAFIDEHPDRDLSAADIAAAAHVSIRAVQTAFRRHLNTTPMGYLRQVRLDRVHRALLAADPRAGVTATDIAMDWGFAHYGRFAARYRSTYGIPPSATLRTG